MQLRRQPLRVSEVRHERWGVLERPQPKGPLGSYSLGSACRVLGLQGLGFRVLGFRVGSLCSLKLPDSRDQGRRCLRPALLVDLWRMLKKVW